MRRPWFPCVVALALTGCGDDNVSPSDGTGSGTTSGTTTSADVSTTSVGPGTAMTEAEGGSETGDTGETPEPIEYARGVRLDRLTANQATQVQLAVEGLSVEPEDYNTRMIPGRRTMVRAFWTLHAEFEPRELLGVLTVTYADGSQVLHEQLQHVEGESSDGGGSQSFQWLLDADDVMPGMTLRARLEEPNPDSANGEISDPPPVVPLDGPVEVELYDVPLQLKIVLVPILHQFENCEAMPDITEQDIADMRMQLEQNNAVQEAIFTVREPMPYTVTIGEGGGFSPILVELAAARAADAPEDNVYYYGLIEPCDGYPPGLLGQALGIPAATRENAGQRVSTGRWNGSGAGAMETFVHEVGHSQGRRHIRCSGGEAGVEQDYPHSNGRIGVWGFGIYDFELRTPTGGRDYMTYCSNEWVSDYGWEQTLDTIETLTSWDFEAPPPAPTGAVLAGVLHEDGSSDWWTRAGSIAPEDLDGETTVEFELAGSTVTAPAKVDTITHSEARYVEVALPEGFDPAGSAALTLDGEITPIDLITVRLLHK